MARNETRALFAQTPTAASAPAYEVAGLTNVTFGDRFVGTNAMERAVDAYPKSVSSRFNLATGYAATGRQREAAAIYQQLISDGQYTWMYARRDAFHPNANRHFNVADESARRLAALNQQLTFASNGATTGAISAAEAGTPVAAIVGGRPVSGRISDAQAFALDNASLPGAQ